MRASLNRLLPKCNGWVRSEYPTINVESPYAKIGTEAHAASAALVFGQPIPDISDEARQGFDKLSEFFANHPLPTGAAEVLIETYLTDGEDGGHPDLVFRFPDLDILIDYKFGYKDVDYEWNMREYAHLLMHNPLVEGHPQPVRAIIIWVQDGSVQSWDWSVEDIFMWHTFDRAEMLQVKEPRDYHVGEWCEHCPIYYSCPGRIQRGIASMQIVSGGEATLDLTDDRSVIQAYDAVKMMEKAVEDLKGILKERVGAGNQIEVDGEILGYRIQNGAPEINAARSIMVLKDEFGKKAEEILDIASIPLGKMITLVTSTSGKGMKAKDEAFLRERLLVCNAIKPTEKVVPFRKSLKQGGKPLKEIEG